MPLFELPPMAPITIKPAKPSAPPTSAEVGRVIARRRAERDWSQPQLAKLAGLKLTVLQRVEGGRLRRGVPVDYLEVIAAALELPVASLLAEAAEPP